MNYLDIFFDSIGARKDLILAFTPFIAALVGLMSTRIAQDMAIKARREEAFNDWWEHYAITEGTEPVLAYLNNVRHVLTCKMHEMPVDADELLKVPHSAVLRLFILGCSSSFLGYCDTVSTMLTRKNYPLDMNAMAQVHAGIIASIIVMQSHLMECRISRKNEVTQVRKHPDVIKYTKALDSLVETFMEIQSKAVLHHNMTTDK